MRAGKLNSRLIIERPSISQDTASAEPNTGAELITWEKVGTVWALIAPIVSIRGREQLVSDQIQAPVDVKITMRWSAHIDGMSAKWRLRFATRDNPIIYNISAPPMQINMGQREIVVLCKVGLNEG